MSLLPGICGLPHISAISHEIVENANDRLQKGQTVKVKLVKIEDRGLPVLSIKDLDSPEPEQLELGKVYEVRVMRLVGDLAVVSLLPGITGQLRKSQISHDPVENINDHLWLGQLIKVKVIEINDRGHVRLSMKALDDSKPKPAKEQTEPAAQPELG